MQLDQEIHLVDNTDNVLHRRLRQRVASNSAACCDTFIAKRPDLLMNHMTTFESSMPATTSARIHFSSTLRTLLRDQTVVFPWSISSSIS